MCIVRSIWDSSGINKRFVRGLFGVVIVMVFVVNIVLGWVFYDVGFEEVFCVVMKVDSLFFNCF